jgi:hypothetical protein
MKKIILLTIISLNTVLFANAQINLIGAKVNPTLGNIDIVKWRALDSLSVTSYPTTLNGYYYSSSVFNAYSGNYYLTGITPEASVLLSFNTTTNQSSTSAYTSFSNITQIDMSTGKIYNLTSDSTGYFSIIEYDINTGIDSVLGTIYEPGIPGIITDATCFNSNDGILYYVGLDSLPGLTLYSIPVRNPVFTYSKIKLQDGPYSISGVHYDNVNNTIFALSNKFDQNGNYIGFMIIEISTLSGEITERGELTGFQAFLGGSSSFDQNTGKMLLVGFDDAFMSRMIVFDTYSNTFQTGFVPDGVSEIVCDNLSFAQNAYVNTSNKKHENAMLKIYPNPSSSRFSIEVNDVTDDSFFTISLLNGSVVTSEKILNKVTDVATENLSKGIYVVTLLFNNTIQTQKLVIQ